MRQKQTNKSDETGVTVSVPVPAPDGSLFSRAATNDVLTVLSRHPHESFTQRGLAELVDHSEPAVRRAVAVLAENGIVVRESAGNANRVRIDRSRLTAPDDPILRVPQASFHDPVRAGVETLRSELTDVAGIVLYGSVARGTADRRSDIDLWVLVEANRAANQRRATAVARRLDDRRFDGDRYEFHVSVESVASVPRFTDDLSRILRAGIVLFETDKYRKVEQEILH